MIIFNLLISLHVWHVFFGWYDTAVEIFRREKHRKMHKKEMKGACAYPSYCQIFREKCGRIKGV